MINKKRPRSNLITALIGGSLLFYAISGINSVLNYALYPIVSRFLNTAQYGETQFLLSTFNQLSVGFVVLNILAIIVTSRITDKPQQTKSLAILTAICSVGAGIISLIGSVVLVTFSNQLNLTSVWSIIFLSASLLLNVPFTILLGQMQGNRQFVASGMISLLATVSKFVFAIIFMISGFGVVGVMAGTAAGMLIAVMGGLMYTKQLPILRLHSPLIRNYKKIAFIRNNAIVGLLSIATVTLLSTVDSIASRLILNTTDAGIYAAIATLAKIILAATAPLIWLCLPAAAKKDTRTVWRYIAITAAVGIGITALLSINPSAIIEISLSIKAAEFAPLLPLASLSMSIYSIALITTAALLCSTHLKPLSLIYGVIIAISIVITIYLLFFTSITMLHVLTCQLTVGVAIMASTLFLLHKTKQTT